MNMEKLKPQTLKNTRLILKLLVEDSSLSNYQLRDMSGLSLDTVKHCVQRLKKAGCIASEKDRTGYQYKRTMTVLKEEF